MREGGGKERKVEEEAGKKGVRGKERRGGRVRYSFRERRSNWKKKEEKMREGIRQGRRWRG